MKIKGHVRMEGETLCLMMGDTKSEGAKYQKKRSKHAQKDVSQTEGTCRGGNGPGEVGE